MDARASAGWIDGGSASSRSAFAMSCRDAPVQVGLAGAGHGREGRVALAAYAPASGHPVPDPARLATLTRARELGAAVWSLGMAHQYPGRYREVAASWLTRMLASPDPAS